MPTIERLTRAFSQQTKCQYNIPKNIPPGPCSNSGICVNHGDSVAHFLASQYSFKKPDAIKCLLFNQ